MVCVDEIDVQVGVQFERLQQGPVVDHSQTGYLQQGRESVTDVVAGKPVGNAGKYPHHLGDGHRGNPPGEHARLDPFQQGG